MASCDVCCAEGPVATIGGLLSAGVERPVDGELYLFSIAPCHHCHAEQEHFICNHCIRAVAMDMTNENFTANRPFLRCPGYGCDGGAVVDVAVLLWCLTSSGDDEPIANRIRSAVETRRPVDCRRCHTRNWTEMAIQKTPLGSTVVCMNCKGSICLRCGTGVDHPIPCALCSDVTNQGANYYLPRKNGPAPRDWPHPFSYSDEEISRFWYAGIREQVLGQMLQATEEVPKAQCPKCFGMIERTMYCYHMQHCGLHICYVCNKQTPDVARHYDGVLNLCPHFEGPWHMNDGTVAQITDRFRGRKLIADLVASLPEKEQNELLSALWDFKHTPHRTVVPPSLSHYVPVTESSLESRFRTPIEDLRKLVDHNMTLPLERPIPPLLERDRKRDRNDE